MAGAGSILNFPSPAVIYSSQFLKFVLRTINPHNIMIRLNVFIKVSEKDRETVIAAARKLVAASLGDDGCIAYDIFESSTRRDVLMICETWRDEAALAAHQRAGHFVEIVPAIQALAEMKTESFHFVSGSAQ